jgi:hypothetical protein
MSTRLTGRAVHSRERRWHQSARSAFWDAISTTLPSTPGVLRPALTSVTRRTLIRAFARERSISRWRLRTFLRSPACDAAKIRCRSRRTSFSAWSQSAWYQSWASFGPFATIAASNLPSGSGG